MSDKTVYIVHAVDTEGPIYEDLNATFERLREIIGIDMEPSYKTLKQLQNKEIDLGGKEDVTADFLRPSMRAYNETWHQIDQMHSRILSKDFRNQVIDSFGGGWVYTWFCLDYVYFLDNPRRKEMGYHSIHDRYIEFLDKHDSQQDGIQWHFHPMTTYREAHRFATSFTNSPHLHEGLSKKIIERGFFPSAFRAGFHTERPDSNWFLEQWIPFDCSNQAVEDHSEKEALLNLRNGRLGDWRRAPNDWQIYNPSIYDYQAKGNCNRYISRCLNMNARHSNISAHEVDRAFARAQTGEPTYMGFTNHDFRDMSGEILSVMEMIKTVAPKYPDVKFKFCEVNEAFRNVLHGGEKEKMELDVELYQESGTYKLRINTTNSKVFGPQPWLAVKTKGGLTIHDNLDFGMDGKSWFYVFDESTVRTNDLASVGVAANNKHGDTFVKVIHVKDHPIVVPKSETPVTN